MEMKFFTKAKSKAGFTLAEMLITIGIVVILLAVAIPAIAQASINYKMNELNSVARQVFVASQNNLTNLKTQGMLDVLKDKTDPTKPVNWGKPFTDGAGRVGTYMEEDDANINLILPIGSVDEFAYGHKYTILYNPDTATVLEVFYSEKDFDGLLALTNLSGTTDDKVKARRDARIGFYNGGDIQNLPLTTLDAPSITVTNDDRLTVNITSMDLANEGANTRLVVTVANLKDPSKTVEFYEDTDFDGPRDASGADVTERTTATLTLDSLFENETFDGKPIRFSTRILSKLPNPDVADPGFPFSEQIKISARLEPDTTGTINAIPAYSNDVESNGLYASKINNETATDKYVANISYPRHLQNLDASRNPDAKHKETVPANLPYVPFKANQTRIINWYGEKNPEPVSKKSVSFEPISPGKLINGYNGNNNLIKDLWIKKDTAENASKTAGLFGTLAGTVDNTIDVNKVRLVNPSINANKFTAVGSLIGKADYVDVNNSYVYILDTKIEDKDTANEKTAKDRYQTIGKDVVGGMIGQASNVNVKDSSSGLAYVEGTGTKPIVGGLIGQVAGKVTVNNTYAVVDNLIAYDGTAAMFVANNTANLDVTNSYAVGNIQGELGLLGAIKEKPNTVNGFFDKGTSTNSYCAVTYLDKEGNNLGLKDIGGFSTNGSTTTSYYLNPIGAEAISGAPEKTGKPASYQELESLTGSNYTKLTSTQSFPYRKDLLELDPKEPYPFKGLKTSTGEIMLHYGSWPNKADSRAELVYYEQYSDDSYGFYYYDFEDKLFNTLKGNTSTIKYSGYGAIASEDIDLDKLNLQFKTKSKYDTPKAPVPDKAREYAFTGTDPEKTAYKFRPFMRSAEIEIHEAISKGKTDSYRQAKVKLKSTDGSFADTERNASPGFGAAVSPIEIDLGTEANYYQLRTMDQIYNLENTTNTSASEYRIFRQTHNITGGDKFPNGDVVKGKPVATTEYIPRNIQNCAIYGSAPFGEENTITGMTKPLFENISGKSTKVDGIDLVNSVIPSTSKNEYGIFGINLKSGTISNCTVKNSSIKSSAASASDKAYVSGFVSRSGIENSGNINSDAVISNCTLTNVSVESSDSASAVGFVGENGGIVRNSHIVNDVATLSSISIRSTTGSTYGFASLNKGTIENSSFKGKLTSGSNTVGFVGNNDSTGIIKGSKVTDVKATSTSSSVPTKVGDKLVYGVAGFAGFNTGKIEDSHVVSSSKPSKQSDVLIEANNTTAHGFITFNDGNIDNASFTGIVKGGRDASGFVGFNQGTNPKSGIGGKLEPGTNASIANAKAIDVKVTSTANFGGTDPLTASGFATNNTGTIKNSHVALSDSTKDYKKDIIIDATKSSAFGFASYSDGTIDNSSFTGTIKVSSIDKVSNTRGSGFVGISYTNSNTTNCKVINLDITGEGSSTLSGFSSTNSGKIANCAVYPDPNSRAYSNVNISTPNGFAFGFISNNQLKGSVDMCSVTGNVYGASQASGFSQNLYGSSTITNSYANCNSVARYTIASGFATFVSSGTSIDNCYSMGTAKSNQFSSGFAHDIKSGGKVSNSYSTVNPQSSGGSNNRYGFASAGSVTNCYYIDRTYSSASQRGEKVTFANMIASGFASRLGSKWTSPDKECYPYADGLFETDDSGTIDYTKPIINPFPMINKLAHHGDWLFVSYTPPSLIYYETYKGQTVETPVVDENGYPIMVIHPITGEQVPKMEQKPKYFIYEVNNKGDYTNTLDKSNDYELTGAGYGLSLPEGTLAGTDTELFYGDGGGDNTSTPQKISSPFEKDEIAVIDKGLDSDDNPITEVRVIRPFKRNTEITLGNTIGRFDKHLTVPISFKYNEKSYEYDIAPYSAKGIAIRAADKPRTTFGTSGYPAEIRYYTHFRDMERYLGANQDNIAPIRYFAQDHDVDLSYVSSDANSVIGYFHTVSYDGRDNRLLKAKTILFLYIYSTGEIKNTIVDGSNITYTTSSDLSASYAGIFCATMAGRIDNCHVINSRIEHTDRNTVSGFVGTMNKTWSPTGGGDQVYIKNSSVRDTEIIALTGGAQGVGFVGNMTYPVDSCYTSGITVTGTNVSGFAGALSDSCTNSYSNGTLIIKGSAGYANDMPFQLVAAGFASNFGGYKAKIDNCYSSMEIDASSQSSGKVSAYGFVPSANVGILRNSYSVSKIKSNRPTVFAYGFTSGFKDPTNSYYLDTFNASSSTIAAPSKGTAKPYSQMNIASMKLPATNWQNGPGGTGYPFPIITSIGSHTGNWPAS